MNLSTYDNLDGVSSQLGEAIWSTENPTCVLLSMPKASKAWQLRILTSKASYSIQKAFWEGHARLNTSHPTLEDLLEVVLQFKGKKHTSS